MEELNAWTLETATESNAQSGEQEKIQAQSIGPKIMNLSGHKLTSHQVALLCRGPKFCVTTKGRKSDFSGDSYSFGRRLTMQEIFFGSTWKDTSLVHTASKKFMTPSNKELQDIIATINKLEPSVKTGIENIADEEQTALNEIKELTRATLEIKKADKTNTFVIMDKDRYKEQLVLKCHLRTPSYEKVNNESDAIVYKDLGKLCQKYGTCLTKNELRTIMNDDWRTSRFYVLPKINKSKTILDAIKNGTEEYVELPMPEDLTSRPIVSGPKSVTKGLSQLLEKILTPLVFQQKTFIKNELDFLRKFPKKIEPDSYIVCCDVKSLYTSIPNELGLRALQYWLERFASLIPDRFSANFIMEASQFVLENNFFVFDGTMWRQIIGTAMGKEMASPYACLTVGYLEETILFPVLLPQYFQTPILEKIIDLFFRFVDDGITNLPNEVIANTFLNILNSMDPSIQWTITISTPTTVRGLEYEKNVFLSVKLLASKDGEIQTDIYYKDTNSHDYLSYDSHHPKHTKDNIAYCLAKTIIIFTSDSVTMEENLADLENWLLQCGHPKTIIDKGIHNARLQGPANKPSNKTVIPFTSTYFSNYDSTNILTTARSLIENSKNQRIQEVFKDVKFINSYRQPPNLLRQITNAEFITGIEKVIRGTTHCENSGCKICKLYLQKCDSFKTTNGTIWQIKCHVHCHSKNVIYYLVCNFCLHESNVGKTDNLRERTNNHISCSRHGSGSDLFDLHVHACARKQGIKLEEKPFKRFEPYFKLYVFMELTTYSSLRNHERRLHLQGHDTINNPNS